MDARPGAPALPADDAGAADVGAAVRRGRSVGWRVGMLAAGALLAGGGVALVRWPFLLAYAVGGGLVVLGALLALTAFAARGG